MKKNIIFIMMIGLCFCLVGCSKKKEMLSTSNQFIGATREEIKKTYGENPSKDESEEMVYENIKDYHDDIIYGSLMAISEGIELSSVNFAFDSKNECIEQRTIFEMWIDSPYKTSSIDYFSTSTQEKMWEECQETCDKKYDEYRELVDNLIEQEEDKEGSITYELDSSINDTTISYTLEIVAK